MTWLKMGDEPAQFVGDTGLIDPQLSELFGTRPMVMPALPTADDRKPTVWVVQQVSGGRLRVLAEWHSTYARPEGTELRFYNQRGVEGRHRVATVRAGSWHWCVAESSLDPEAERP